MHRNGMEDAQFEYMLKTLNDLHQRTTAKLVMYAEQGNVEGVLDRLSRINDVSLLVSGLARQREGEDNGVLELINNNEDDLGKAFELYILSRGISQGQLEQMKLKAMSKAAKALISSGEVNPTGIHTLRAVCELIDSGKLSLEPPASPANSASLKD
jgi:hypothetical protein